MYKKQKAVQGMNGRWNTVGKNEVWKQCSLEHYQYAIYAVDFSQEQYLSISKNASLLHT